MLAGVIHMSFKKQVNEIPQNEVPSRFQVLGEIILIKMYNTKEAEKKKLAEAVLSRFPHIKTVCEIESITGDLRTPRVKKIAGNGTTTVHKEHGLEFALDVTKVMFSKGNLTERKRLLQYTMKGECVIDMFAGIGYFSLGLAKHAHPKKIIAIEKNQDAYEFLKENIKKNKITTITPILGDCKEVAKTLQNTADRIIMGYFPHTERFLPAAISMLKPSGVIHFHNTYREHQMWEELQKDLDHIKKENAAYTIIHKKIVKSVAPRTYHVVCDARISRLNIR